MVCEELPPCLGVEIALLSVVFELHFVEALAGAVHAVFVVGAVTARPEGLLGNWYVVGDDRVVDESKIRVQHLIVLVVDNRDWYGFVRREGADLAPVAVVFLFWVGLGQGQQRLAAPRRPSRHALSF